MQVVTKLIKYFDTGDVEIAVFVLLLWIIGNQPLIQISHCPRKRRQSDCN